MAYCGVKPSCGFNKKGQRVRVCKRHRHLKTTALGKKLTRGEPKRPYHDQSKYHEKYSKLDYIKRKAARGSKAAQEQLKKILARKENGKGKGRAKKHVSPRIKPKAAKKVVRKSPDKAVASGPTPKELKAARDKRYRDNLKKKAAEDARTDAGGNAPAEAPPVVTGAA